MKEVLIVLWGFYDALEVLTEAQWREFHIYCQAIYIFESWNFFEVRADTTTS